MAVGLKAHFFLLFPSTAYAFLAFKPNCTLPPEVVQYVSNPQVRGTLQVLWSCLTVLLLCTWSIQHPSVPIKHDGLKPPSWIRRQGLAALTLLTRKRKRRPVLWNEEFDEVRWNFNRVKWMGAMLLFPEFYFAKALTENCAANDSRRQINDEPWTTMHGFFANMGGFVMNFETTAVKTSMEPTAPTKVGRELSKPCPGGVPSVYYAQDPRRAAAIELLDCRKICGQHCNYRRGRQASEVLWRSVENIKENELETIKRSWSDGKFDDHERHDPIQKRTILASINTALVPFAASTTSTPLQMSAAATLINSPESIGRRQHGDSFSTPLVHSSTFQSTTIPEVDEEDPDAIGLSTIPTGTKPPLSIEPVGTKSEALYLLPHPYWTGSWPLSALQIHKAHALGLIPAPPYISSQDLRNQSKSDVLIKLLTVWQILWLVITILVRASQNLSITLIEVTVLAFAATALSTYILLWHKPQDVKVPHTIQALRRITREDVIELAALSPLSTMKVYEFFLHGVAVRAMGDGVFPFTRGIRTSSLSRIFKPWRWFRDPEGMQGGKGDAAEEEPELYMNPVPVGIGFGGAIFGAVHMTAANFFFPTAVEKLLWRVSCGILIGLPVVGVTIYSGYMHYTKTWQGKDRDDSKVSVVLLRFGEALIPIYLLARLYLFVETFRSLAFSEVSAFKEVNWPSAIPHYM